VNILLIKEYLNKFIQVLKLIKKLNWKFYMNIACFVGFLCQFYLQTYEYLSFNTSVNVEFKNIIDDKGFMATNELPAFYICYDLLDKNGKSILNLSKHINEFLFIKSLNIKCRHLFNGYPELSCMNGSKQIITKSINEKLCVILLLNLNETIETGINNQFLLMEFNLFYNKVNYTFSILPPNYIENSQQNENFVIFKKNRV